MSSLISAEIAAACSALGYLDPKTNKYQADENTLETVKDLIRYLRRDDETHEIRRQLGATKVIQTDLLPLLLNYWEENELFDVLLRVMVNLTTPALILWNQEIPTERTARNHYLQIEEHLQSYKQAFASESVWAVLSSKISKTLEIDFSERGDENSLTIERILILIRNVLYVPANLDAERRPDNDASVHDQVVWALHQSGMLDIIQYVSSSEYEQSYYLHILEILSFMLREQSASELAQAAVQRSQTEKLRDEADLLAIRHRESRQKQERVKMYNGARHSRFGGTFVVKSMKSIGENELIYHKPLNKLDALNFDAEKSKVKTPKNRRPFEDNTSERRSAFSVRLILKEFCSEFLNAYNNLMCQVKSKLTRAKAQQHDESYYLWAMRFFLEFNRCYKFEVKLVSETMSVQSFHYVQQQMESYFDNMNSDKKKIRLWSRRLHLALLAYKELLLTIAAMDKSPDGTVRDCAKVIKSNIFYVLEYRELILTLLVTFDEMKMSQTHLKDLLETQHVFLRMLQAYCQGKDGQIIVQKKSKTAKRQKKSKAPKQDAPETAAATLNLEKMWDEAGPQLSVVLEGTVEIPTDVVPFDAASDVPIDEQKSECMLDIQRKMRQGEYEGAIALLRAAREVWPENECFGSTNMAPEEEFMAMREIFFADLGENDAPVTKPQEDEYDEEDEEDEEEMETINILESDFKFDDFIKRLAHPKVVRACALALADFEKNTTHVNHCIIKLLHRIAWDCKMHGMVFQASIFRIFQKIFDMKALPQFKELAKFATFIIRQFVKVAEKNPKVFMEALFWKSSRDAFDLEEGYGSYQEKSSAATKAWTELEEDELRRLFMEHQEKQEQQDVVDWIQANLIDNTRTRRGILKKLKEMYLLTDYKGRGKVSNTKPPKHWSTDEETQLRELFEQFREASDPLSCIMDRLEVPRPKNRIIEKLLVMGLVQDRKELRKKRSRKSQMSGPSRDSDNSESDASDSDREQTEYSKSLDAPQKKSKDKANKKSRKTKKSAKSTQVSSAKMAKLLIDRVNEENLNDALEWLKESFEDAAEDWIDDMDSNESGVPIVPILDSSISAMENPSFLEILKGFGVQPPADEQESYWRIPVTFTVSKLSEYASMISQALDKTLVIPEETENATQQDLVEQDDDNNEKVQSSDDEDIFDRLKKMTKPNEDSPSEKPKKKTNKKLLELAQKKKSSSDEKTKTKKSRKTKNKEDIEENKADSLFDEFMSMEMNKKVEGKSESAKKSSRIAVMNDSDSEESDKENATVDDNVEPQETSFTKKSRRLVLDDSDEENVNEANTQEMENAKEEHEVQNTRRARLLSDSDDDNNTNAVDDNINSQVEEKNVEDTESSKRLRSLSDSDSEETKPKSKKSRIIDSDED